MNRKEYIGIRIAKARKKKRLTQKALAELTGIDKTTISKIEKGKLNITIDTIDKLCKAVDANIRFTDNSKIFEDLVFEKHPFHLLADEMGESYPNYNVNKTCYQAKMQFENGLHISVIIGKPFYSNGVDTYEVCLYSESEYQEIFPYLNDMEVSNLMEYAQIIKDIKILDCLKDNGYEMYNNRNTIGYIKHCEGWYIHINPCGRPIISASKVPYNFKHLIDYEDFVEIKAVIEDPSTYIKHCESHE